MKKFTVLFLTVLFFVSCKTMPVHNGAELTVGKDKIILSDGKVIVYDQYLIFYQNGYDVRVQKKNITEMNIKYK